MNLSQMKKKYLEDCEAGYCPDKGEDENCFQYAAKMAVITYALNKGISLKEAQEHADLVEAVEILLGMW